MTVDEQILVLRQVSEMACKSKEAAKKFLRDAGIIKLSKRESIKEGLRQAQLIHESKMEGKSFDDFLNEL